MQYDKLVFTGDFRIRTYEIDQNKRATIVALIQLMQEAAMQNVIEIGLSVWDMEVRKISWVVMRMDIDFEELPRLGDTITIRTHAAGFDRLYTYRDYRVWDAANKLIAKCASTWLLMDTEKRKMVRIPEDIASIDLSSIKEHLPRPERKLPKLTQVDQYQDFKVLWHHLDFNRHLSNIYYFQWMLETFNSEFLNTRQLSKFQILFKQEATLDEDIRSEIQKIDEHTYLHRLIRMQDGQSIASARTIWH